MTTRSTYDVSFWLNDGRDDGLRANVRMLVEVPQQDSIDDEHELAATTAKDALRPFLNSTAYFGEWDPIPVYVSGSPSVDKAAKALSGEPTPDPGGGNGPDTDG